MIVVSYIIILIYTIALVLIFMYAIAQLNLLLNYLKAQNKEDTSVKFDFSNPEEIPFVTIQLPVYNELYVMERLLTNIVKLKYPKDKLEIQVLDDSTDESVDSTATQIRELQTAGIDIKHNKRTNRKGFRVF